MKDHLGFHFAPSKMLDTVRDSVSAAIASVPFPDVVRTQAESIQSLLQSVHKTVGEPSVTVMLATSAVTLGIFNYIKGNYLRPANVS